MTFRPLVFACAWLALSTTGCCKACSAASGVVKEMKGPEASVGEKLLKERLVSDKELRKQICGVDTKELTDLVVKKNSNGDYSIEGTPVERPMVSVPSDAADAGASGKPSVDAKKVLVCTAAVYLVWSAKEDPSGTTWTIDAVRMQEITTPGAEYKRRKADWD